MIEQPKDNQVKISNHFSNTIEYWHNLYDDNTYLSLSMADRKKIVLDLVRKYATGKKPYSAETENKPHMKTTRWFEVSDYCKIVLSE